MMTWTHWGRSGNSGEQVVGEKEDKLRKKYGENGVDAVEFFKPLHNAFETDRGHNIEILKPLAREEVYEVAVISPVKKDLHGPVEVQRTKQGLFRTKVYTTTETGIVGQAPATMADVVEGGSQEDAVLLEYLACDSFPPQYSGTRETHYTTGTRFGNYLEMQFYLPKDIAQKVSQAIQEDPTILRKLTEAYV